MREKICLHKALRIRGSALSTKKHKHELRQHKCKRHSDLLLILIRHQLEPPAWGGEESFSLGLDAPS